MALTSVPDPPAKPPRPTIAAAVDETIDALGCPKSDSAMVAAVRLVADTIDDMPAGQRGMMLGQTMPLLLKGLQELEARSVKRRSGQRGGRPSKVAQLRAAHAASPAKRKRTAGRPRSSGPWAAAARPSSGPR